MGEPRLSIAIAPRANRDPPKPLNLIVHRPSGDTVPTIREPGGNRAFVPAEHNEIWLRQGDPAVYFTPPAG